MFTYINNALILWGQSSSAYTPNWKGRGPGFDYPSWNCHQNMFNRSDFLLSLDGDISLYANSCSFTIRHKDTISFYRFFRHSWYSPFSTKKSWSTGSSVSKIRSLGRLDGKILTRQSNLWNSSWSKHWNRLTPISIFSYCSSLDRQRDE